ncbi:MAG TPA: tRNA (N(6)-L-threonylcarbamoyladenosine(37)-C(2))-methylthiotransferase MtaB [Methylomirabilota bacterium]|nr:tRNA (N(6)-L-threonylcarbamoyladenosine(37)-C(2))-methylthiotransferase MtaB [Methylomirabilota bacterium]
MSAAPTVRFETLGCRLNQVDTGQMQALVQARGFALAAPGVQPDVVVVNTCAVTAAAELSDRRAIRRAARAPGGRVVVTGCWAQTSPDAIAVLGGVDLVVGTADKARLPDLLVELLGRERGATRVAVGGLGGARLEAPAPAPRLDGRSRAFVKVQDGCQHRCAFCIVPFARGASRSLPPEVVEAHARTLLAAGHPEIVLTGVDLGHYGADLAPRTTLAALLRRLAGLEGLRWLRLSSLLPAYVTEELFEVLTTLPVIAPHLHVPLQSGSDRVLRAMRRPYTSAMYRGLVERLAAALPAPGLGADVIVGFPGETAADFAATLALVEALPFSYLHVFPYSARRGTEAATLAGRPDPDTVAERARQLREVSAAKRRRFRERLIGRVEDVLVLARERAGGELVGLTGNYVEVAFAGAEALRRRVARVRVTAAGAERARGVLEETTAA